MKQDMNIITIEAILDRLGIDLHKVEDNDASEIVRVILVYMMEECAKSLEHVEVPISDMLWIDEE